ncbi:MAG TPA: hypothetical protein VN317_03635 [Candidatus Methanoperedens sp.]|nr:hypothetical protein [Candidatus Methanoperedens sp.]
MAAGIRLGVPIVFWSQALGLASYAGSLALTYSLAQRLAGSFVWGFVALLMLGTNYTFSAYATGGLETSLHTLTVLLSLHLAYRAYAAMAPALLAAFSVAAAAAVLTRLDSVLLISAPALALLWRSLRLPDQTDRGRGIRRRRALALVLPGAAPLAAWFAWKAHYYGELLPLTFYAKQGAEVGVTVKQGFFFLFEYVKSYWMFPQVLLLLFFARALWQGEVTRWFALGCGLWWLYVVWFGGDFMEFRLMVVVLPAWVICLVSVLAREVGNRRARYAMTGAIVVLAIGGSWHHQVRFTYARGIESVANLQAHVSSQRWARVGEALHDAFRGHEDEVTVAVTAAGAIPFYAGVRVVDMLGLNDTWIARHGLRVRTQPGHERTAPFAYLVRSGVNLVIAQPIVLPSDRYFDLSRGLDLRHFHIFDARPEDLPASSRLIEIPIGEGYKVMAISLVPNARVDKAMLEGGWRSIPLASIAKVPRT